MKKDQVMILKPDQFLGLRLSNNVTMLIYNLHM